MESQLDMLSHRLRDIDETRKEISTISFENVVEYCIDLHDKTLTRLLEMQMFIEANIGLFWNENDTLVARDPQDWKFGCKNCRNKVVVHKEDSKAILEVWVDGGIYFWYNLDTKKAVFIGNNIGYSQSEIRCSYEHGNHEGQYCKYNYFDRWDNGKYPTEGYERFFIHPTSLPIPSGTESSYELSSELKAKVDEDWEDVSATYKALIECVEQIQKDESEYLSKMRMLLSQAKEA